MTLTIHGGDFDGRLIVPQSFDPKRWLDRFPSLAIASGAMGKCAVLSARSSSATRHGPVRFKPGAIASDTKRGATYTVTFLLSGNGGQGPSYQDDDDKGRRPV